MTALPQAEGLPAPSRSRRQPRGLQRRMVVGLSQLLVIVAVLAAWQWLPLWHSLSAHLSFLNPAVISSPRRVAVQFWNLLSGDNSTATIWPFLAKTLEATGIALVCGIIAGVVMGLVFSGSRYVDSVFQPFLYSLNAIPIVAMIPVLDIICGPNLTLTSVTGAIIVFFMTFFNAREGARTIAPETVQNTTLLGAGKVQVVLRVRLPYVVAWTFTALPNAISFGLLGVVTAEFLSGVQGIGYELTLSLANANPTNTISVAILLAVISLLLVGLSRTIRSRVLHWWDA